MRRSRRALPVIVIGVLMASMAVIIPASPGSAAADSAQLSTHDLQVVAVGDDPARLDAALDPGATARRTFVVTNRTSGLRLTVRMSAVDATADKSGSGVTYATDAKPGKPGSWLTLSDVVTTLEPKAEVRVSVSVTPPANAEPGRVHAGLVVRIDRAVRMADDLDAAKTEPITLPVSIDVKGAATALVSISRVQAVKAGDKEFLELTFQNGGATANTMVGAVKVLGPHPHTEQVRAAVAPLTHTLVRVPFEMPSGKKSVAVAVTTDDTAGNQAAWNGNVSYESEPKAAAPAPAKKAPARASSATTGSGGRSLPSPAAAVVTLLVLLAVAWFASELRRSRGRRGAATPTARHTAGAPPAATAVGIAPAEMGALAAQVGSLVDAIDRLVARMGEGRPAVPAVAPAPAAPATPVSPAPAPVAGTAPAESGALLYAPAASPHPAEEFDPYDWPTPEQLDHFVARRQDSRSETP